MAQEEHFDVVVIGGGPGGYPAAIRAKQNGATVALIEEYYLGGTCLNWGCIPTKTLIANAELYKKIQHAEELGINVGPVSYNYSKMAARKDQVVSTVRDGLESLVASNEITLIEGRGRLAGPHIVQVTGKQPRRLKADHVILATGSHPKEIPAFPFDGKRILNSDHALALTEMPNRCIIIGAGVIGCEFASLFNNLGVEVTLVEALPRIIATEADNVSATLHKAFEEKNIRIITNALVDTVDTTADAAFVSLANGEQLETDLVLVAVGRGLNTQDIGLETVGIGLTKTGAIEVNTKMQTSHPWLYAIGDITGRWQLAHVASHQGLVAANCATGIENHMHYDAVPSVIFTDPEIGSVGMTLPDAIERGIDATLGSFPFSALGKAQAAQQTEGFAQIVIDKKTNQVLGAQVVGHEASLLVAEMAIVIANEMTVECITETIHAHPTIAEAWLEAALVANDTPLHWPPAKKRAQL